MSLQKAFSKPYLPAILVGKLDNATNAATDKTKKKQPQNQQIMKKKMSGDQIIQKLMAVRVLYLTPKNSLTPNKKDHL